MGVSELSLRQELLASVKLRSEFPFGPKAFGDASRKWKGKGQSLISLRVTLGFLIVFLLGHMLEKKMCADSQTDQLHRKRLGDSFSSVWLGLSQ